MNSPFLKYADSAILIFAKAPVAGRVKTRLLPQISAAQAAQLHVELTQNRLQMCTSAGLCDVQLWCSPDVHHPFFAACRQRYRTQLQTQQGDDLGERMSGAIKAMLHCYKKVVIIGSDAPALGMPTIESAIEQLDHYDVALVPAEDGGYVLLGASSFHDDLLADIPWGTKHVLADTLRNLDSLGLEYTLLPECWDVDRPEDLKRYRAMNPETTLG
jgi:rSAM/selenodomain-associated transferase 1